MRSVNIDNQEIKINGAAITPFIYESEFNKDILGDLAGMKDIEKDMSKFNSTITFKILWAMAATVKGRKNIPDFFEWIQGFERINLADTSIYGAVMEEAQSGFLSGLEQKAVVPNREERRKNNKRK
jgi:hypothetical protein